VYLAWDEKACASSVPFDFSRKIGERAVAAAWLVAATGQ
jgi:hypothetical protein